MRFLDSSQEPVIPILAKRKLATDSGTSASVAATIADVAQRGDSALLESARTYDCSSLASIHVSQKEWDSARVSLDHRSSIETAFQRIVCFHKAQLDAFTKGLAMDDYGFTWRMEGTSIGQRLRPLQSVGMYVPGGAAAYPSSVLMLAGPVSVAGVSTQVCVSPATPSGELPPAVLVALKIAGVDNAIKVGGAAAIAALAFGTESVPKVDKITGPGNRYVNEAKKQLWGRVGLDGFTGPSEVCVFVDDSAKAKFAAADFLTQIEHAPDNAGFLVSADPAKYKEVVSEIESQLVNAPRASILRKALQNECMGVLVKDVEEGIDVVNAIAPEHLSLCVRYAALVAPRICNAGCILMGDWTPESAADYCLGPSHTLPTATAARFSSPVNVLDFMKIQSLAELSREQLEPLMPLVAAFAELEGLPAHGLGTSIRRIRYPSSS